MSPERSRHPDYARGRPRLHMVGAVLLFHALAVAAVWWWSWPGFWLFVISTAITLQFGMTLGYHRLLTHRAYRTLPWIRRLFAALGSTTLQTGPITWAAIHRIHHAAADGERDPHSPRHGLGWSHLGWVFHWHPEVRTHADRVRFARDLAADPVISFLERHFLAYNLAVAAGVLLLGTIAWGPATGLSLLLWGVFVRVVVIWHLTFAVNSLAHVSGYRNYDTPDSSGNVWWLGLLLFGDGWHNNHHAHARWASHGHRWFELDLSYWWLRVLERLGLVWNVCHPPRYRGRTGWPRRR